MARFTRLKVLNTMIDTGMVPVFYNADIEVAARSPPPYCRRLPASGIHQPRRPRLGGVHRTGALLRPGNCPA